MIDLKNLVILALVLACAGLGWKYLNERTAHAETKAAHAQQLKAISDLSAEAAQKVATAQQAWNKALAAIDTERTKEKIHALAENDRLRRAVADGARRLRIQASCPARGGDLPASPSTPGVADAAAPELTPDARTAYFDLRAEIASARVQILGLQDYARACQMP